MTLRLIDPDVAARPMTQRLAIDLGLPTGLEPEPEESAAEGQGWFERMAGILYRSSRFPSFVGAGLNRLMMQEAYNVDYGEPDDDFNAYDYMEIPGWWERHPWMHPLFESGRIRLATNDLHFQAINIRREENWKERERWKADPWLASLAAQAPGQIADVYFTRGVLKVLGLTGEVVKLGKWAQTGNFASKALKTASLGAIGNVGQELVIIGLERDRTADDPTELGMAAAGGFVLAGLGSLAAGGLNRLGRGVSSRRLTALQNSVNERLARPEVRADLDAVTAAGKDSADELRGLLDTPSAAEVAERAARAQRRAQGTLPYVADDAPLGVDLQPRGPSAAVTPESPRPVRVLETPETRDLIAKVKAKHGDAVIFQRHPLRDAADFLGELESVQRTADTLRPTDPGAAARLMKPYRNILAAVTPGARLRNSPAFTARLALRTLGDDAALTTDNIARPLTHAAQMSAENMKRNLDSLGLYRVQLDFSEAFGSIAKGRKPITYTFADGTTVRITGRGPRKPFQRAVMDYLHQLEEAQGHHRTNVTAPAQVHQAVEAIKTYMRQMGLELNDVGLLRTFDTDKLYVPHRWIPWKVRNADFRFKSMLLEEMRYFRTVDFETGQAIDPSTRALIDDVLKGKGISAEERGAIRKAMAELGEDTPPTEGWLQETFGDAALARYLEEVDRWQRGRMESTFQSIAGLDAPGVETASIPAVLRNREVQIRPTRLAEFLDDDAMGMLTEYHRQTAGRVAVRRTIKNQADIWAPLVKDLTGEDLAGSGWDPKLLRAAVKQDHQRWRRIAARNGDETALKIIDRSAARADSILDVKLAELQDISLEGSNPGGWAGWFRFGSRQVMRGSYMAYLGKVGVSQIPDLAGLTFYRQLSQPRLRSLRRTVRHMKKLPPRHLQALYVAMNDSMGDQRALSLALLDQGARRPYGPGRTGRIMSAADAASDKLSRQFTQFTGMNLFNRTTKRAVACLQTQDLIVGARKMVRAAGYMADGLDEAAAVAKAGMTVTEAARYNRLGLNADRGKRLLDRLFEDGVDYEGNRPWAGNRAAFDATEDAIFPNFEKWWDTDRELFDVFTGAINGETMNVIVEPKLMSKPLHLQTTIGRLVQQFQMFNMSWGNQLAYAASQQPAARQAQFFTHLFMLGAMSDSIHNHLSGRRSFDETAELWLDKPLAMSYHAVDRSGMTGWLSRPLAWTDQVGFGPGALLKDDTSSRMYYQNIGKVGVLGAPFDYGERLARIALTAADKGFRHQPYTWQDWHMIRKVLPFNNLVEITGFQRLTEAMRVDNPFGPGQGVDPFVTGPAYEATRRRRPPEP